MTHFLQLLGHNLQSIIEHGGYLFLTVTTTMEGIPVIGQLVPGHTIVVISGFLSKMGVLNLDKTVLVVFLSAVLGDYIGYCLGKRYGVSFLYKFGSYVFIKQEYIDKAREIVKINSIKAIILGRFSPITRSLSPFLVGASGIHSKKFWVYDSLGALLWVITSVSIGYIFGTSYHVVAPLFGRYIFIAIIIGLLVIWGYRFINKQFDIFAKYELITLFFNIFGLYLFFKTIQDALTDKVFLLELDLYINTFLNSHATDFWTSVFNAITNIFSPLSISVVAVLGLIYFIYHRKYTYSIVTALSLIGGYIFTFIIKNIVDRIRPMDALVVQGGYSFPSGHAVAITIFSTLVIYIFLTRIRNIVLREILISISVVLMLVVSFSRIYLGVHWLSDVLAGIGFGLFWTTSTILLIKYLRLIANTFKIKIK